MQTKHHPTSIQACHSGACAGMLAAPLPATSKQCALRRCATKGSLSFKQVGGGGDLRRLQHLPTAPHAAANCHVCCHCLQCQAGPLEKRTGQHMHEPECTAFRNTLRRPADTERKGSLSAVFFAARRGSHLCTRNHAHHLGKECLLRP